MDNAKMALKHSNKPVALMSRRNDPSWGPWRRYIFLSRWTCWQTSRAPAASILQSHRDRL